MNPLHQPNKDLVIGRHMQRHSSLNARLYFVVTLQLRGRFNSHTEQLIISTVVMFFVVPLKMRLLFTVLDNIILPDLFVGCCYCLHPAEINAVTTQ